jgi:hypothetical protein
VKWDFLGAGTGAIDVAAQATVTGPVQGYSRTISGHQHSRQRLERGDQPARRDAGREPGDRR